MKSHSQIAVFGGGCFWCTEAVFSELKGVSEVVPGYTGGETKNPTYDDVCSGTTGHVEVSKITYNPDVISYNDLLTVFFVTHDPSTVNRQGADVGTQYRSAIFTTTPEQFAEANDFIADVRASGQKVVTEVLPLPLFYIAENWHQQYFARNNGQTYCEVVIAPKIEKLQARFQELLKK